MLHIFNYSMWYLDFVEFMKIYFCVKCAQIRNFIWSVFSWIQSEYRNIRTRKNFVFGHFSHSACFTRVQIFSEGYLSKIACASISHMSLAFLLSIIENFLSEKAAIDRNKHVSIMDTKKVAQCGSKETQCQELFLQLYSLYRTVCSFLTSIWYRKTLNKKNELNVF